MKKAQTPSGLTYAGAGGVSYLQLDSAKLIGQECANVTMSRPLWTGARPLTRFVGESASVFRLPDGSHIGHVEEGLGTKIEIANWLFAHLRDPSGYAAVSQDTVAMIVNDLITVGILPTSVMMHLAVGSGEWLTNMDRVRHLMEGWMHACISSGAAYPGGETPALKGIVADTSAVLGGSAFGFLSKEYKPYVQQIRAGDVMIGIESSGLHANGISLFRKVAEAQDHEVTEQMYEEGITPTHLYAGVIHLLRRHNITPSYLVNVTGHGWRKLMRAPDDFTYRVLQVLPTHGIFNQLAELGPVEPREMWGNYNMGTGFVIMCRPSDVGKILRLVRSLKFKAMLMGSVEKGPRRVIIEPVDIEFGGETLDLRN